MEDLRMIDAAIDQYAIEMEKSGGDKVSWADIQQFLKPGTRLYNCQGKDIFGNPYSFSEVDNTPKLSPQTFKRLSFVAPAEFWSPFHEPDPAPASQ